MAEGTNHTGEFETREDAGKGTAAPFRLWMSALDLAKKHQEDWVKSSSSAIERFRLEKKRMTETTSTRRQFNILYSAVSTVKPQLYNSTPIPDVRRRYGDEDPVGQVVSEVLERGLSYCVDDYDFDAEMKAMVHNGVLTGRAVPYVEYDAEIVGEGDDEAVTNEKVRVRTAQWDEVLFGPAKRWEEVPWIALRFHITRKEAKKLNPEKGATVNLDFVEKNADEKKAGKDVPDIFKRLTVWKIWDKEKRKIVFIAPSFKEGPFRVEDDELNLKGFFPFPKPYYDTFDSTSLVPLVPYDQWKDQAEELDLLTRRIYKLTSVLRWRGIRPAHMDEFDQLKDADDGDLIPSQSFDSLLMANGDAEKSIWLWPIEKLIIVIRELIAQRETVKQTIFEISGLSDVQRGSTDPNETLGAQQLKAQFGSVRLQERQEEVQRVIRDLFAMKAEIMAEQFSDDTLQAMVNMKLPTAEDKMMAQMAQVQGQQIPPDLMEILDKPTWQEIRAVLSSDEMRSYRVDIETNSTILGDLSDAQENISRFIEGLAAFGNAVGPAVEAGAMPPDVVADLLTGFARNFRLGRQAEDAIERWGRQAKAKHKQQEGQEAPQDPAVLQAQADVQAAQQQAQIDEQVRAQEMQMKAQESEREFALKQQEAERQGALDQQKISNDFQLSREKAQAEIELKRAIAEEEIALKREIAMNEAGLKREVAEVDTLIKAENG